MNKMLAVAAGVALLGVAAMGTANAQGKANGPFADVPTDNWAYQSVEKLRDAGIVIGYPDGTYAGKRALTRYEFATAIARLLALLPSGSTDTSAYVTKDQLADALAKVNTGAPAGDNTALSGEVAKRLESNEGAITAVKGLVQEFQPELKSLGVDIADVNAKLASLDKRVAALEEEVNRVKITGEVNVIAESAIATKTQSGNTLYSGGISWDNVNTGNASKSLYNAPNVFKDIILGITGKVADNATAVISFDYGNYMSWLNTETLGKNVDYTNADAFNLYEAYLSTPASIPGIVSGTVKIGQFGTSLSQLVFGLVAPDDYSGIDWVNNGNQLVNGIQDEGTLLNTLGVKAFVGKAAYDSGAMGIKVTSAYGANVAYVDNIAGVRLTYPISGWTVGYNYLLAGNGSLDGQYKYSGTVDGASVTNSTDTTTQSVWGFDLAGTISGNLGLTAEYAVDQTGTNSTFANVNKDKDNAAYDAYLTDKFGALGVKLGYRAIEDLYGAPGNWFQIGSLINPTNIGGGELTLTYAFSPKVNLSIEGDSYEGLKNAGADGDATIVGLGKKDTITRFNGSIGYAFAPTYKFTLGYEDLSFNVKGEHDSNPDSLLASGKPTESYVNIGLNHDVNKNAAVSVLYQILAYNDKSTGLFNTADTAVDSQGAGGILWTQASFKF